MSTDAAVFLLSVSVRGRVQRQIALRGVALPSARLLELAGEAWKAHYGVRARGVPAEWSLLGEPIAVLRKIAARIAREIGLAEVAELGLAESRALGAGLRTV